MDHPFFEGFDVMWSDFDIFLVRHPTIAVQGASEGYVSWIFDRWRLRSVLHGGVVRNPHTVADCTEEASTSDLMSESARSEAFSMSNSTESGSLSLPSPVQAFACKQLGFIPNSSKHMAFIRHPFPAPQIQHAWLISHIDAASPMTVQPCSASATGKPMLSQIRCSKHCFCQIFSRSASV